MTTDGSGATEGLPLAALAAGVEAAVFAYLMVYVVGFVPLSGTTASAVALFVVLFAFSFPSLAYVLRIGASASET